MVIKKSIIKETLREIFKNKKQFISLLLIVAIGTGFFYSLNKTTYDIKSSSTKYHNKTNPGNIKIASELGFDESDKISIKSNKKIKGLSLIKTANARIEINKNNYNVKLNSINKVRSLKNDDYINRLTLVSGKYPSTINEGLVEEKFLKDNKLALNDLITLIPENQDDLRAKKIKIVGTVKSNYVDNNKDIDYYMYLEENEFSYSYYNEGFITIKNTKKMDIYSAKYKKYINDNIKTIKSILVNNFNDKKTKNISDKEFIISNINNSLNDIYSKDVVQETLNDEIKNLTEDLEINSKQLQKIKKAKLEVTRNTSSNSSNFVKEINELNKLLRIFAILFYLIVLIYITSFIIKTINKDEKKINYLEIIGLSRFDIILKYLLYVVLVSTIGSLIGNLLFGCIVPKLIGISFKRFYNIPAIKTSLAIKDMLIVSLTTLLLYVSLTVLTFFFRKLKIKKTNFINNIYVEKIKKLSCELFMLSAIIITSFGLVNSYKNTTSTLSSLLIINIYFLIGLIIYNIKILDIDEKEKEILNLRMNGFYNREILYMDNKQNIVTDIISIILGITLGSILTFVIVKILDVNYIRFHINFISFVLSLSLITILKILINTIIWLKITSKNG